MKETSMDMIPMSSKTVVVGSECGCGLKKEVSIPTKFCHKCKRELPITEFTINKSAKDGLQSMCKECKKAWSKEYHAHKKMKKEKANTEIDNVVSETIVVDAQEKTMLKVYSNPDLSMFTPRQLMQELKQRGYRWEYMLEPQRKVYYDKI